MRREVAQVAVVPGRLDPAVDARRALFVVPADPDAVTVRGLGAELRMEALVDQRVLRLVEQVVDPYGRPGVCEPAAHVSLLLFRRVRDILRFRGPSWPRAHRVNARVCSKPESPSRR